MRAKAVSNLFTRYGIWTRSELARGWRVCLAGVSKATQKLPRGAQDTLRPLYYRLATRIPRFWLPKSRADLFRYWREPWDGRNLPEQYLEGFQRSEFLVNLIRPLISSDAVIMEIGCNIGRNLDHLYRAGFTNLVGIEISERALESLRSAYPQLGDIARLHCGAVEDIISTFPNRSVDLIFTMAVLQHLHPDSEFVFDEIARVASRYVITIEEEGPGNWRQFPRNYRIVFEVLGLQQVVEYPLSLPGMASKGVGRVFRIAVK